MTIGDSMRLAVRTGNAALAGRAADFLRRQGLRYKDIAKMAVKITGCDPRDWEALLYESEEPDDV